LAEAREKTAKKLMEQTVLTHELAAYVLLSLLLSFFNVCSL